LQEGTDWEGGLYSLTISFPQDYPNNGPRVAFAPHFFHPNVYPDGAVCLSILTDWFPETSLKQILVGVRDLLNTPNNASAANPTAFASYNKSNKTDYKKRVKQQAVKYRPVDEL
jgi:ubiquitin-conjugating enzyme E2 I